MLKQIKFDSRLIQIILDGTKTATWRLNDDKDLKVDDQLELINRDTKQPFAKAIVTEVLEKPFKELTEQDRQGHESYTNDQVMYQTFSQYYSQPVNKDTVVKVVRFKLMS